MTIIIVVRERKILRGYPQTEEERKELVESLHAMIRALPEMPKVRSESPDQNVIEQDADNREPEHLSNPDNIYHPKLFVRWLQLIQHAATRLLRKIARRFAHKI
jgi:hypothetical protein